MKIYKCDRCGKTEPEKSQNTRPDKWKTLGYSIGGYVSGYVRYQVIKDICPECAVTLKLPDEVYCQEVADRFLELIEEIVQGVIENQ